MMVDQTQVFITLGQIAAIIITYKVVVFVWIYFLKPSSIHKYSTPANGKESWALVTGASDGIGLETVKSLLKRNFNVILHGRNPTKLSNCVEKLQAEFPDQQVEFVVADATDAVPSANKVGRDVSALLERTNGVLRVLINNVGGSNMFGFRVFHYIAETPPDLIPRIMALNAVFPHTLTRILLPWLREHGAPALIINIGSMAGLQGMPFVATYSSCKAANHTWSSALANEMICAGTKVEVIGLIVGDVVTTGNKYTSISRFGFSTISAEQMAEDIVARVGCGVPVLIGNWRQALQGEGLDWTPGWLADWMKRKVMMGRRRTEDKML
jgi:17beta-estradiol 17-dehydrogenase / very-long-chain 3-oxoacyl-CoA reductase